MRNEIKKAFKKAHVPEDDRHKYLFQLLVDLFDKMENKLMFCQECLQSQIECINNTLEESPKA